MLETFKKERSAHLLTLLFLFLTGWWIWLFVQNFSNQSMNLFFGASYGLVALVGGLLGIHISQKWGFTKSTMGKTILFLAFGLLAQEFGQLVFSYYNIVLHVDVPYPSLADLGFFATIPFYILALYNLAKSSGIQFQLRKTTNKILVLLMPLVLLSVSYGIFLMHYSFVDVPPLQLLLDFGYPLGQSIFVAMALLIYLLSTGLLGGLMKNRVLFLLIALVVQYAADFNFLYQNMQGTWINGGYGDYLYLTAYFLMALGIVQLLTVYKQLKHTK